MTAHAWHYRLPDGTRGTLAGDGLNTRQDALDSVCRAHHAIPADVELTRADSECEQIDSWLHSLRFSGF